jgi:ABC-type bacteriocin/lantibiotic exporter with double-glycine peptidase domain
MRVGVRVQTETYHRYLSKPYEFHLQNNSAHLIRNIQNASSVINGGVDPFLVIATDGLVAIGLFTLLLVVEPAGTIVTLAFLTLGAGLLHVQSRRRLERWGRASNELTGEAQQALQEGLAGVKELLVLDRLRLPLAAFSTATERKGHIMRRYGVMQTVPRLWLEVLSMVSFGALVLVLIAQNVPPTEMVTTLGLVAATAFRTMPSVNRISATFQSVRFIPAAIPGLQVTLPEGTAAIEGTVASGRFRIDVPFETLGSDPAGPAFAGLVLLGNQPADPCVRLSLPHPAGGAASGAPVTTNPPGSGPGPGR